MSRVRVIHEFDLLDENGNDATTDQVENVVSAMTVQVQEPVLGYDGDGWDEIEGSLRGSIEIDIISIDSHPDPVALAMEAFWHSISRSYPDVTTGDLDPITVQYFESRCRKTVNEWFEANRG